MLPPGMLLYGSDAPFAEPDPARVLDAAPVALRAALAAETARATFPRLA